MEIKREQLVKWLIANADSFSIYRRNESTDNDIEYQVLTKFPEVINLED